MIIGDEEKSETVYVKQTVFAFVVRCILFVVIFTLLFYFLHPTRDNETQDERMQRVLMQEKLKWMQKARE